MTTESTPFCPDCNIPMIKRNGKFGAFYGCTNYPKCKRIIKVRFEKTTIVKESLPTNVKGTEEQESIWHAIKTTKQNIIMAALAGCGKTFSLVYALTFLLGLKVIFVAFNKHIVTELERKIPEGMIAKTMNSFGLAQVRNYFPRIQFEEKKLYRILDTLINEDDDNADFVKDSVAKLVNLCKVNLLDGKDTKSLDDLCQKHTIELNDHTNMIYTLVPQVLVMCKKDTRTIDYADQLWFVYAYNMPVEQYDVMLADEIQDWNKLQQYVAMKAIADHGRFIGVGDENQAIYGFSGADTESINNMVELLKKTDRNVSVMPLTFTRRCPKSHVALACQIVPEFKSMPDAIEGFVASMSKDEALTQMTRGDMGICRRNAPLISYAYALINNGIPVIVKGRDIGSGLIVLINKMKSKTVDQLLDKLETFRSKEIEKLSATKKNENKIQALNDKIDTIIAISSGKDTIKAMIDQIDTLFTDNNPQNSVILSSVHKAKGLEADRVFIIEYDRIEIAMSSEEFAKQEKHLHYVALTRSKRDLFLIVA